MQQSLVHHKPPTKRQHKKISKFLSANEQLILVTSIGPRYFWFNAFFLLIIPLLFFYLSIFMFSGVIAIPSLDWLKYFGILAAMILLFNFKKATGIIRKRQSFNYVLTNRRCLIISGIFTRKIITAPLDRITHITVEQSFAQRFLYNTGHLLIITAGFDQREIVIENIANPVKVKIFIEELSANLDGKGTQEREAPEPKLRAITLD